MRYAAQLLGRHQNAVADIQWDINVDGSEGKGDNRFYKRYYTQSGKRRRVLHEQIPAGAVIGINCVVPSVISDDDLLELMRIAGQYRGISPWIPNGDWGRFEVESIRPRRNNVKKLSEENQAAQS
jgi:hypothetical protein